MFNHEDKIMTNWLLLLKHLALDRYDYEWAINYTGTEIMLKRNCISCVRLIVIIIIIIIIAIGLQHSVS